MFILSIGLGPRERKSGCLLDIVNVADVLVDFEMDRIR